MTAEPVMTPSPAPRRPGQVSSLAHARDLADSVVFYGILGLGIFGPIVLAISSELFR